ncbi:hypothetical protein CRYUN_Cryun34aG0016900 [Craigia yunnanensis]
MLAYKSFITLFFLSLLSFTIEAQVQQTYLNHSCSNTTTFPTNGTYQANLNHLLSSLSSNATRGNLFYNATSGRNSDVVYGLFLCRGDVSNSSCQECVSTATNDVTQRCPVEKIAVIWYENCLVHYSNQSIFSIATAVPAISMYNITNVTDQERFDQILAYTINDAATLAVNATFDLKNFATREAKISEFQTLYSLVQCTPDLSRTDCDTCLRRTIAALPNCCSGRQGGRVLTPSCNIRYEVYLFYTQTVVSVAAPPSVIILPSPTALGPVTPQNTSAMQTYLYHICPGTFKDTPFSEFQINLDRLLIRRLYGQGSISGFFSDTEGENPDKVYGLFLCRGDVQLDICQSCIDAASYEILKRCPGIKEAIIWYDYCMVRYSYKDFFPQSPSILLINDQNVMDLDKFEKNLDEIFDNLTTMLSNVSNMYATKEVNVSSFMSLYGLVQCTPDLSVADCQSCIRNAIAPLPFFLSRTQGARVLQPSCNIRYEIYPFYGKPRDDPGVESANKTSGTDGSKQGESKWIGIVASLSGIYGLTLFCSGGVFLWRKRNFPDHNSEEVQLIELGGRFSDDYSNENSQGESGARSQEFPSIQLDILQAATKQFCDENKLGEGGFGPVYKGKLADGKEIAVKRLSRTSGQGLLEFKNEVMLIAKLQHRNLVRLLGCCLEQNEKLLVYEYMPNKSLDVFLFDSNIGVQLDWQKRLSIINGIARGILYLHEDSRLRIIHRDLKASNVLLDHEMNPKISDFGMARIFGGKQSEANTNRVVGTYGYMAPEYAMEGLFSVKSDVFSFGVLLLEIISGKRNSGFHLWERGESLLTFAWKLWSKGQGMELIDPLLAQSCVVAEVLKCIHIGLLCVQEDPADRPTMSSVIVMLGSETIVLPLPEEPAFSVGRFVSAPTQSTPNDGVCTVNEVTISIVSPR